MAQIERENTAQHRLYAEASAAHASAIARLASAIEADTDRARDLEHDSLTLYRRLLVAQQDALASMGRWYLAPFLPGMIPFVVVTVRAQKEKLMLRPPHRRGNRDARRRSRYRLIRPRKDAR